VGQRILGKLFPLWGLIAVWISGCISSGQMIADGASSLMKEVASAVNRQSDVALVRQGLPSYLMLLDGLIQKYPENPDLLLAGAQVCGSYAALLEEEERAVALYARSRQYALRALERHPALTGFQGAPLESFQNNLRGLGKKDVPLLFGAGSAWGGWIAHAGDGVEAMAELPWVEALMEQVLQVDPDYYYGGAHLFKGILLSARPEQYGGNLTKAREHFQEARRIGQGKFLMTEVYYAQYYARQRLDRDLFETTLKKVLATPPDQDPDLTLVNTLARQKAGALLEQTDEFF
jgi:hypothetical protein